MIARKERISSAKGLSRTGIMYDPYHEGPSLMNVKTVQEDPYCLHQFQSSLFATVLEDTITELRILSECNTEMRITKIMYDKTLLLALKYGVKQRVIVTNGLDGIDPHNLGSFQYKLDKLEADRKYFNDVLSSTYKDMTMNHSYEAIARHVNKVVSRDKHRLFIIEDEAKNKMHLKELARQLRQQRNHIKSVNYDNKVTIDDLRTDVEDASVNSEIRTRYVNNWQNARTEQHVQTIYDIESKPSGLIEHFKERTDHEQRAHSDVELLMNITINETLEKVEEWMNKYDIDMESMDLKIQIQKNDYQNILDKRIDMEKTIKAHAKLMKEWVDFKDAREKERAYVEKMLNSAITVQAWWRGLLVRKQLGPYRPKKKPKVKK